MPRSLSAMSDEPVFTLERDAFLEIPTPRRIPSRILKSVVGGSVDGRLVGLAVLIFGLIFLWIFFPFHLPQQWRLDVGPSKIVSGRVLAVKYTDMRINGVRMLEHRFAYELENGEYKEGNAYTPGGSWQAGTPLRVRYLASDPDLAVPEGARLGVNGMGGILVLIFPLLGAALFFGLTLQRFKDSQILRMGSLATATITSVEKTSVGVGSNPLYKIHLTSDDKLIKLVKRTYDPKEVSFAMRKQDAGEPVKILYLPYKLKRFLLPELWNEEPARRP